MTSPWIWSAPGTVIVHLRGDHDIVTAPQIECVGAALLAGGAERLLFDASGVTFIDSLGLEPI